MCIQDPKCRYLPKNHYHEVAYTWHIRLARSSVLIADGITIYSPISAARIRTLVLLLIRLHVWAGRIRNTGRYESSWVEMWQRPRRIQFVYANFLYYQTECSHEQSKRCYALDVPQESLLRCFPLKIRHAVVLKSSLILCAPCLPKSASCC